MTDKFQDKSQVIDLATSATYMVKEHTDGLVKQGTKLTLEYSPESFSASCKTNLLNADSLKRVVRLELRVLLILLLVFLLIRNLL